MDEKEIVLERDPKYATKYGYHWFQFKGLRFHGEVNFRKPKATQEIWSKLSEEDKAIGFMEQMESVPPLPVKQEGVELKQVSTLRPSGRRSTRAVIIKHS